MHVFAPVIKFFIHSLVGTLIFGVISTPAVILNCYVERLSEMCSHGVIVLLTIGEYGLLIVDVSLFLIFLVRTGWVATREMCKEVVKS